MFKDEKTYFLGVTEKHLLFRDQLPPLKQILQWCACVLGNLVMAKIWQKWFNISKNITGFSSIKQIFGAPPGA